MTSVPMESLGEAAKPSELIEAFPVTDEDWIENDSSIQWEILKQLKRIADVLDTRLR